MSYASYGYTETLFYLSQDMRGEHIHREHRQDQTEETLRAAMKRMEWKRKMAAQMQVGTLEEARDVERVGRGGAETYPLS